MGEDKKETPERVYNFKDIIKTGYKLLEVIKKVKKDNITFSNGIDLIKTPEMTTEEKVKLVIEKIDIIKNYLNNEKLCNSFE